MSRGARIGLVLLGVLVLLTGLFLWAMESEYGADLNYTIVIEDGTATVFEETAGEVAQFDSNDEAVAYTEQKRAEGANYLLPGLVITSGIALLVLGLVGFRSSKQEVSAQP
jgi:hypothetical protein